MAVEAARTVLRKNGASANSFTVHNEGTTGQFEDTTHSDTFIATDDVNYAVIAVGTSGSIVMAHIGVMFLNTDPTTVLKDLILCGGLIPFAR